MNDRQLAATQQNSIQISSYNLFEENPFFYNELNKIFSEIEIYKIGYENQSEKKKYSNLKNHREKNIYDYIPYNYFTLDEKGFILEMNHQGEELFGIQKDDLHDKILSRYILPESQLIFHNHINKTLNEKGLQLAEINILTKKSPIFPAWIISKSFSIADNKIYILSFIIKFSDISAQEIIYKNMPSGKLSELVMHEINNPLAITANYLYGCIHRMESGRYQTKEIVDALRKAYGQYNNIANIILRMKNFYCQDKLEFKLHNMNEVVTDVVALLKNETEKFFTDIIIRSSNNIPSIKIDKLHIQQVLLNLARNSIDAMRDHSIDEPKIWFEMNVINRKKMEICVIDNGPGIPEEIKYKLFSHNFTTKNYGTGLGLSICRNIIEAHGGELLIDSTFAGNTCFKFILPIDP